MDLPLVEPAPVGVLGGEARLDLVVVDDPPLLRVDQEHTPWLEPAFANDLLRRDVEDTDLAGQNDESVVGHPVTGGTQSVAVEHRADDRSVGEGNRGRTVPGLHQRGVVPVEVAPCPVHRPVVLPGFGDHHQHRVRDRPARQVEQLEHLVEGGRVARARGHHRERPLQPGNQLGPAERLAGAHPVPVARERVDLTVVREVAVRMGERPRREGIGREPRVDEGEAADHPLVGQVRVELRQLVRGEHALVGDRAGRQGREVAAFELVLHPLPEYEGAPVEHEGRIVASEVDVGAPARRTPGASPDVRRSRPNRATCRRRVPRAIRGRPAPRPPRASRSRAMACDAASRSRGKEGRPGRVAPAVGQIEVRLRRVERVGDLDQDPGAVSAVLLAAGRAAVGEMLERTDRLSYERVGRPPLEVRDERDTACIVLEARVVEAAGRPGHLGPV